MRWWVSARRFRKNSNYWHTSPNSFFDEYEEGSTWQQQKKALNQRTIQHRKNRGRSRSSSRLKPSCPKESKSKCISGKLHQPATASVTARLSSSTSPKLGADEQKNPRQAGFLLLASPKTMKPAQRWLLFLSLLGQRHTQLRELGCDHIAPTGCLGSSLTHRLDHARALGG